VVPHFRGRSVELEVTTVHLIGLSRRPGWLLGHDLLSVLLGAGSGSGDLLEETTPATVGLGRVRLQPLDLFLSRALPVHGWKVPSSDRVKLSGAALDPDGASLAWTSDGSALPEEPPLPAHPSDAADEALLRSDLSGAAAAYTQIDDPRGADRALSVLLSRETTLRAALELADKSLARWPRFVPALLAAAAVEGRSNTDAAFARLSTALDCTEPGELWLRIARAAARVAPAAEAADLHQQILAEDSGDPESVAALAAHFAERREFAKLAALLERCVQRAAEPQKKAQHLFAFARVCAERLDDGARAMAALEQAVELDAGHAAAWAELGKLRGARQDAAGAVAALERLSALQPSAAAFAQLADRYVELEQLDRAQEQYARSLELAPNDADVCARAAALADRRGDHATAQRNWSRVVELAPPDGQRRLAEESLLKLALARRDLAEARRWRDSASQPQLLLDLARLEEGDPESALRTLSAALEQLTGEESAHVELWRARLCQNLNRDGDRRAALVSAWRRAPGTAAAGEALRALVEEARARRDDASEGHWLDELLGSEPGQADWLRRRGELHAQAREWARARARLEQAGDAAPRRLYADVLGQLGEHRARAEALGGLAETDPSLWIDIAEARLQSRDLDAAEEALSKAREHAPGDASVQAAAGELAWLRRDWEEVAATVPSLLAHSQGAARTRQLLRLGLALERQGAADEARARLREAVDIPEAAGDDLGTAWRHLAELEERRGAYEEAAATWSAAARDRRSSDGNDARAEKHRRAAELLHRRAGRSEEALRRLDEALALDEAHLASLDLLEAIQTELGNDQALAATLKKKLLALSGDPRRRELVHRLAQMGDGGTQTWQWVLEQDPSDPEALRQLSQAALDGKDLDAAARLAAALPASTLDGQERHGLLVRLSDVLVDGGRIDAAEKALAAALALWSDTHVLEKRVRLLLDRLVDPVGALEAALAGLQRHPDDARRLTLVAETALAADEPALRADALVRLLPTATSTEAWTTWALEAADLFATRLDEPARAQQLYERILYADPKRLPAEALRAAARKSRGRPDELRLYTALRDSGGAHFDDLLRLSQLHAAAQQNLPASEALADAIVAHVRELSAQGLSLDDRGRTLLADLTAGAAMAGAYEPAVRALSQAAEIEPDPAAAASKLGEAALLCRTQLRDLPRAADLLERALQRRPDSALLLADFEAVMRHVGDPSRLRRAYEAHLQTRGVADRAAVLTRLAQLSRDMGDEASFSRYQKEMQEFVPARVQTSAPAPPPDPSRARALFLAVAVADTGSAQPGLGGGELLAAIAELKRQVDILPAREVEHSRALRQRLAWMYRRAGDLHAAFVEFERLAQEEPENRTFIAAVLETSMLEGRWSDAVAALDRLQRLADDSVERATLIFRMGALYEDRLGDPERAVTEYLRAVDVDPGSLPPLWRLVDCYWRGGDDNNLIDIARLLHDLGAFRSPQVERMTQARAWVALALDAFERHQRLTPPASLESELTRALNELAERPSPPHGLASAAKRLALAAAINRK
jgi:tetratricopeptide (TPR) repeat protein